MREERAQLRQQREKDRKQERLDKKHTREALKRAELETKKRQAAEAAFRNTSKNLSESGIPADLSYRKRRRMRSRLQPGSESTSPELRDNSTYISAWTIVEEQGKVKMQREEQARQRGDLPAKRPARNRQHRTDVDQFVAAPDSLQSSVGRDVWPAANEVHSFIDPTQTHLVPLLWDNTDKGNYSFSAADMIMRHARRVGLNDHDNTHNENHSFNAAEMIMAHARQVDLDNLDSPASANLMAIEKTAQIEDIWERWLDTSAKGAEAALVEEDVKARNMPQEVSQLGIEQGVLKRAHKGYKLSVYDAGLIDAEAAEEEIVKAEQFHQKQEQAVTRAGYAWHRANGVPGTRSFQLEQLMIIQQRNAALRAKKALERRLSEIQQAQEHMKSVVERTRARLDLQREALHNSLNDDLQKAHSEYLAQLAGMSKKVRNEWDHDFKASEESHFENLWRKVRESIVWEWSFTGMEYSVQTDFEILSMLENDESLIKEVELGAKRLALRDVEIAYVHRVPMTNPQYQRKIQEGDVWA